MLTLAGAALLDYGGNRHGFLAFAEIHPDYYQIPLADRKALLEEERARTQEAAKLRDEDYQLAYAVDVLRGLAAVAPKP